MAISKRENFGAGHVKPVHKTGTEAPLGAEGHDSSISDRELQQQIKILIELWSQGKEESREDDINRQESALDALAKSGQLAVSQLSKQLQSTNPLARSCVAWALTRIGNVSAVPELLKMLKNDPEAMVRYWMAMALGKIKDMSAVTGLLEALKSDPDTEVRRGAAHALGEIKSVSAVPELLQALTSDQDATVRATAAWALGGIKEVSAVPGLLQVLRADPDAEVRTYAAWALGGIEDVSAVPGLLEALRADQEPKARVHATNALACIKDVSAVPGLLQAFTGDPNAEAREAAASALGWIKDVSAVPQLLEVLRADQDPRVRATAADVLENIGIDVSVVPRLLEVLSTDQDAEVRRSVVLALGWNQVVLAVSGLLEVLRTDRDPRVRATAAWALGWIKDVSAVPGLLQALRSDQDARVRVDATKALGEIEDASAVPGLLEVLRADQDFIMRSHATKSLERIKDVSAVSGLLEVLRADRDPRVRARAALAFGYNQVVMAVPELLQALRSDQDAKVRAYASWALARCSQEVPAGQVTMIIEALIERLEKEPAQELYLSALSGYSSFAPVAVAPKLIAVLTKVIDNSNATRDMVVYAAAAMGKLGQAESVLGSLHRGGVNSRLLDLGETVLVANYVELYCFLLVGEILKERKTDTLSYGNLATILQQKGLDLERDSVSGYMKTVADLFCKLHKEAEPVDEDKQDQQDSKGRETGYLLRGTYLKKVEAANKRRRDKGSKPIHDDPEKDYFRSRQGLPFKMFERGWQMWEEVRDYFTQAFGRSNSTNGNPARKAELDSPLIKDNIDR